MELRTTRKTLVVVALVGGMLAGGVALAAWLATGTGTGAAKAVTAETLVVADGTASADLYPGMADGDLYLTVENTNDYPVAITAVETAAGSITSDAGLDCQGADTGVSLDAGSIELSETVAANSTISFTVPDVVNMSNASDDSCQGAAFSIPVTVSGASDA